MFQKSISSYYSSRKRIGDSKFSQEKVLLVENIGGKDGENGKAGDCHGTATEICQFLKKAPIENPTGSGILSHTAASAVPAYTCSRMNSYLPEPNEDKMNTSPNVSSNASKLPNNSSKSQIHGKILKETRTKMDLIILNCSSTSKKTSKLLPNNVSSRYESNVTSYNKPKAYEKYSALTQTKQNSPPLPCSYRYLFEIFKCVDLVCAMFFNRKEIITFKKLKGIVQKVLRKNFSESHLAQIKNLYPEAYLFTQTKMRNFGSTSKQDYYQLVISPSFYTNVKMERMNEQREAISLTQVLIRRQQNFHIRLLKRVTDVHAKFLASLNVQVNFLKNDIVRWHPEFNLDNCPEIEKADLPQPPEMEKYSSAKDMLSAARNLFNTEKMEDYKNDNSFLETQKHINSIKHQTPPNILNRIPVSLVEKIRAKQNTADINKVAINELKSSEIVKVNRLPILLSQLRNIFITEKKNVLPLEIVLNKILFSFQMKMARDEIEVYIKFLIAKSDGSLSLHKIRNMSYLKMDRSLDLKDLIKKIRH